MMLRLAAVLLLAAAAACSPESGPGEAGGEEAEPGSDRLTMEVDARRVPCVGVGPMQCYRIRSPGEEEWRLFYDAIQGFDFEPGFRYVLEVERTRVPNPPADASSFRYRLIEITSREPAAL